MKKLRMGEERASAVASSCERLETIVFSGVTDCDPALKASAACAPSRLWPGPA